MKLRKLFTIENKILIPLVTIALVSVISFLLVFYRMEYELKLNTERNSAQSVVDYINADINQDVECFTPDQLLKKYKESYHGKNLFLFDGEGNLIFSTRELGEEEIILQDTSDNRLGWRILYCLDSGEVMDSFVYEQRYVILGAVAGLLIIIQASIYISYNISDPICELSERFTQISRVPELVWDQAEEYTNRWDEVGQLARAFQAMMKRLHTSNDRLIRIKALNEGIVENIPMGVVVHNQSNRQVFRNQKAEAMLTEREERSESGQTLEQILAEMAAKDEVLPVSVELKDRQGRNRNYELSAWKLTSRDQQSLGTLYTIDDVTYKCRMEEKVNRDEKLAYTGELAADLAHEVRNPLAGIRAGLQVVERKLSDPRDQMLCTEMVKEVDRVNILVENMLNISRKRESEKTRVALNVLSEEMGLLYSKVAANKGVRFSIYMEDSLWVIADERELRQILINLINNSIKAMKDGGAVNLIGSSCGEEVSVVVEDNGPGMSPEQLERVLKGETGGLGVTIVRRLVKQNGGQIKVESQLNGGTRTILTFHGTGGIEHAV